MILFENCHSRKVPFRIGGVLGGVLRIFYNTNLYNHCKFHWGKCALRMLSTVICRNTYDSCR